MIYSVHKACRLRVHSLVASSNAVIMEATFLIAIFTYATALLRWQTMLLTIFLKRMCTQQLTCPRSIRLINIHCVLDIETISQSSLEQTDVPGAPIHYAIDLYSRIKVSAASDRKLISTRIYQRSSDQRAYFLRSITQVSTIHHINTKIPSSYSNSISFFASDFRFHSNTVATTQNFQDNKYDGEGSFFLETQGACPLWRIMLSPHTFQDRVIRSLYSSPIDACQTKL